MKKLFGSLIAVLFCLAIVVSPVSADFICIPEVGLYCGNVEVGILSIDGGAGVTMQEFDGYSNSETYSLVGANGNHTCNETDFRGVGVGSNAYGNATRVTLGNSYYRLTGSGVFAASSSGTMGMNTNNGGPGYVYGTYRTSSTVHIHAR